MSDTHGLTRIGRSRYPRTSFVARNGFGCYFDKKRKGWTPGWEIGHGHVANGVNVCIRDSSGNQMRQNINYDAGSRPNDLLGKWSHFAFVFDRVNHRVTAFINGKAQSQPLNIAKVVGSIDNTRAFNIGTLYGWKTDGVLDEFRMYNRAVTAAEVKQIAGSVPPMDASCPVRLHTGKLCSPKECGPFISEAAEAHSYDRFFEVFNPLSSQLDLSKYAFVSFVAPMPCFACASVPATEWRPLSCALCRPRT